MSENETLEAEQTEFSLVESEEQADTVFAKLQRLKAENASEKEIKQALEELELILDGIGGVFGDTEEMRIRNKYVKDKDADFQEIE